MRTYTMHCYPKDDLIDCDECIHNDMCPIYQDYKKLEARVERLEAELLEDYEHP